MAISAYGCQRSVAAADETYIMLRLREPVCDTALVRVYLMWAKLRVGLYQQLIAIDDDFVSSLVDPEDDHTLAIAEGDWELTPFDKEFLDPGIADVCYLYSQLQIGESCHSTYHDCSDKPVS
jgi:hypothetical protein